MDDLAALLAAAHVPTLYVLVGQSIGGDQAWLYASRYKEDVGGFLLMNAGFFTLDWDAVKSVWSDAEIAEEKAHVAAGLGEIEQAASPPAGVPYVVMMSTIAQCASTADVCGRIYPFYEAWGRDLAKRTPTAASSKSRPATRSSWSSPTRSSARSRPSCTRSAEGSG